MKKLLVLFLFVLSFAKTADINSIVKQIPKNSPNYSFALILKHKIDTLTFIPPKFNTLISTQEEYVNAFNTLLQLIIYQNSLPSQIEELNKKTAILQSDSTPIARLEYIYYTKLSQIKTQTLKYLNSNIPVYEKNLFESLKKIDFDTKQTKNKINVIKTKIDDINRKIETLKIDLQKYTLLNDTQNAQYIKAQIKNLQNYEKKLYKNLFDDYIIIWSDELKRKDKNAFNTDDYILDSSKNISDNLYTATEEAVSDFERLTFGAKILVYGTKKELSVIIKKLLSYINYPLFSVGNRVITPLNFAIFILVLVIGWFVGKYYKYLIYKIRHKYKISYSTATLLANMGYYTIITTSFLIALKIVGLDLSSLAIIAGALSVGIGFGLQNVVSNFVSGIILMFERSIKVGDYIQIDQDTRGEVVDISMRSTIIRTNDNINLIIPNQSFIQNNVINWTLGDDIIRFRVPFGTAYGSDIDKVEKVVLNAIKNSDAPIIKKHPTLDITPKVVFMEMGESSLNFELFVWVKGEYARRPRRTRSIFLKLIYNALNEANINIPFPQQDLHIKDSVPFEIIIKNPKNN